MNIEEELESLETSPSIKPGDRLECQVTGVLPLTLTCSCATKVKESTDSYAKPTVEKMLEV